LIGSVQGVLSAPFTLGVRVLQDGVGLKNSFRSGQ
jgi:hypothetical protein